MLQVNISSYDIFPPPGYLSILVLFAVSNGYLTALLMMRAITEKNLHPEEVDVASSIMLIYLTVGLCLGATLSIVSRQCVSKAGYQILTCLLYLYRTGPAIDDMAYSTITRQSRRYRKRSIVDREHF